MKSLQRLSAMLIAMGSIFRSKDRGPRTTYYPDPEIGSYQTKRRKRGGKTKAIKSLRCEPGTIIYHDKLVRHFGRKQADIYGRHIQSRNLDLLPTESDFNASPAWRHLKADPIGSH